MKKDKSIIEWDNWKGGVVTLVSDSKLKQNQVKDALNLLLVEDGIWETRPGSAKYTTDLGAAPDGFIDYTKSDGTNELIGVGNGLVRRFVSGAWQTISGMTPTAGLPCDFCQYDGYLHIYNGTNNLGRYDGTNLTTYTALSSPGWGVTPLARAVLSAGSNNYYYRVSASNAAGETLANAEQTIGVNKARDLWNGTSEGITLVWTAPAEATQTRYTIYMSDLSGYEKKLADVDGTLLTWTDYGTNSTNDYMPVPDTNTTTAPKFTHATTNQGRMWAIGDPDNPYRAHWTGSGAAAGAFNFYDDGGWVDLDKGDGKFLTAITEYQNAVYITKRDSIYKVKLEYSSVYETNIPVVEKIISGIGCVSHRSVVKVENDTFFFGERGVFVLGNEPNVVSDVLRTNELSSAIRPYIAGLTQSSLSKINGYYRDAKVYFCVPYGGANCNRTIIYDRERGCWIKDWSIGFSQLGEYKDSTGKKVLLGASTSDGFLDEISANYKGDRGVAFSQRIITNKVDFGSWTDFVKLKKAYIRLRNPRGAIDVQILGTAKDSAFSTVGSSTIDPSASAVGVGTEMWGDYLLGDCDGDIGSYEDRDLIRYIKLNKRVRDCQLSITTDGIDDYFTLLGLRIDSMPLRTGSPSNWKAS